MPASLWLVVALAFADEPSFEAKPKPAPEAAPAPAPEPTPTPSLAAAPSTAPGITWPREFSTENGQVTIYAPQVESLAGDTLTARAAVSWSPKNGAKPTFGVAFFKARIDVDRDANVVRFRAIEVTKLRFPGLPPAREQDAMDLLGKEMTRWDLSVALTLVQTSLAISDKERNTTGLKVTPPKILVAQTPTALVPFDGQPRFTSIEGTTLMRVINTPCLVLLDTATKTMYLAGGATWFEAKDATGPWTKVAAPSPAVAAWFAKNPPPPIDADDDAFDKAVREISPNIVVATEPTELVQFEGKPAFSPLPGSELLFATNTDRDVFIEVTTQMHWLVLAGRWYKAKTLDGPWTPVRPDKLPAAFAKIPPESEKSAVLAFVAGTDSADDALADALIPTTATVTRTAGKDLVVTWDGEPKFKAIEGTQFQYGINTTSSVLLIGDTYWVCAQAVWYQGKTPKGPWTVSTTRPPGIDGLPPSAPVYNTKYVYVYDSTPDVVVVGYLPGYAGMYPYYGTVVYGTGYIYAPYIGPAFYAPPPATWGVHVSYNPWMGWGVGVSYGTPFFRVGVTFHAGGYGCYGPVGYRPMPPPYYRPPGYRPPGGYPPGGGYRPGGGNGNVSRPGPHPSPHNLYQRPNNSTRNAARPSTQPVSPSRVGGSPNNVYGDRNGNAYRQGNQGWESPGGNRAPSASPSMNRDAAARQRSGLASPSGGGGYRGGGGGYRGGGGGGRRR